MAKFSIIIPTYNRAHYITAAIESALSQTERDFEIIVIDDGSTDNTTAVVGRFVSGRTLYLQQPHTGTPGATRNTGLARATGEYIAFLDSDDLYLPDRLARHTELLSIRRGLDWIYSDVAYFRDDGSDAGTVLRPTFQPQGWVFPYLLVDNFIHPCGLTIRRDCLEAVGGFDDSPGLAGVEDYELCLRIAAEHEIALAPGVLGRARLHAQNISGGTKLGQYSGALDALAKTAAHHATLVAPYRTMLRQRRSLLYLAATRAYLRQHDWEQATSHLLAGIAANPSPSWWGYLLSRPHPARDWLTRQEQMLSSLVTHPGESERDL